MRFIGIGDLHLSSTNGHGGFSRFVESSDSYIISEVSSVLAKNEESGIENIIFYGDICDSTRMSYKAHEQLVKLFDEYRDLRFHLILGNHDKFAVSGLGDSLDLLRLFKLKNVTIYDKPETVDFGDCKVRFLSYPFADFKKKELNVCHLDLNGGLTDSGRVIEDKIDPLKFNIVSGHIHTSGKVRNSYYSGTLYQLTFGEKLEGKGYHVIECTGSDFEVSQIPWTPKYKLQTCTVDQLKKDSNTFYKVVSDSPIDPSLYNDYNIVQCKISDNPTLNDNDIDLKFENLNLSCDSVFKHLVSRYDDSKAITELRAKLLAK